MTTAARLPLGCSAAGAGDEGGDDVGGVPGQGLAAAVVAHGGAGISVAGGLLHLRRGTPASRAAVMNACRRLCGVMCLSRPAARATRRTIRLAAWRSFRRPDAARNTGPPGRSPIARSHGAGDPGSKRRGHDLSAGRRYTRGTTSVDDRDSSRHGDELCEAVRELERPSKVTPAGRRRRWSENPPRECVRIPQVPA
jgi:hypothetical protein